MAATKKVKVLRRLGDPRSGVIIAPGATVELTEHWADYHIGLGNAEEVKGKAKADDKPKKDKK